MEKVFPVARVVPRVVKAELTVTVSYVVDGVFSAALHVGLFPAISLPAEQAVTFDTMVPGISALEPSHLGKIIETLPSKGTGLVMVN